MDDTSERLVRVETKLDALITLNDTRIAANERRIDEVRQEAADRTRHEKANYDQKLIAIASTAETRSGGLEKRIDKIDKHMTWIVYLIVGAVAASILGTVLISNQRPTQTAQLTLPAIVQQHTPASVHPEAAK